MPSMIRVVVAEDDPGLRELFCEQLGVAPDFEVIGEARSGREALDYLFGTGAYAGRDVTTPPQVVLLDLKLPKISGLEVLKRIRDDARTRMQPVVILTSSTEEQDLAAGYGLGANSYIRKPVDFDHFSEAARQIGLYWLVLNEAPPRG